MSDTSKVKKILKIALIVLGIFIFFGLLILYLFWGNVEKISSQKINLLTTINSQQIYSTEAKGYLSFQTPYSWRAQETENFPINCTIYCQYYQNPTDGYLTYQYSIGFRLAPFSPYLYNSNGTILFLNPNNWVKKDDEDAGVYNAESKEQKQAQIDLLEKIYMQRNLGSLNFDKTNSQYSLTGSLLDITKLTSSEFALLPQYIESSDSNWRGLYFLNAFESTDLSLNPTFRFTLINKQLSKPMIIQGEIPAYYSKIEEADKIWEETKDGKKLEEFVQNEIKKLEQAKLPLSIKIQKWQLINLIKSLHLEISK